MTSVYVMTSRNALDNLLLNIIRRICALDDLLLNRVRICAIEDLLLNINAYSGCICVYSTRRITDIMLHVNNQVLLVPVIDQF